MDNRRKHSWQKEMSVQRLRGQDKLGMSKEEKTAGVGKATRREAGVEPEEKDRVKEYGGLGLGGKDLDVIVEEEGHHCMVLSEKNHAWIYTDKRSVWAAV